MDLSRFDQRPLIVAVAGPNGGGKTTFFHAHLRPSGLRFVNADVLARELALDPYAAAAVANQIRRTLVQQKESFIFETVLSDPVGDKVRFLLEAIEAGYAVVLCYIGVESADISEQRVAMRVSQGGHDVPTDKLRSRHLEAAILELPNVLVFDNTALCDPYKWIATFEQGRVLQLNHPIPKWLAPVLARVAPTTPG